MLASDRFSSSNAFFANTDFVIISNPIESNSKSTFSKLIWFSLESELFIS
jgi:hypothetical protein